MHDVRLPLRILTEAAESLGYVSENIDDFSGVVLRISNGDQYFFAGLGKVGMYPINPHYAAEIANDKAWAYRVLAKAGFAIPKGEHFFLTNAWQEYRPQGKDKTAAKEFAEQLGYPVFVKPNDGSSGVLAELIMNAASLEQHLANIAEISPVAMVQHYIDQPEYRIFIIDSHIEFIYQRTRPSIQGDGIHTIEELINSFNTQIVVATHRIDLESPFLRYELARRDLDLKSVLAVGESLVVTAHANLASGGKMCGLTDDVPSELHDWASKVIKTLGLRVAGIDVFSPVQLTDVAALEKLTIIEVNSNPNLAGIYENAGPKMAVEIWKKILLKFFRKS